MLTLKMFVVMTLNMLEDYADADTDTCIPLQKQRWREVPLGAAVEKAGLQIILSVSFDF